MRIKNFFFFNNLGYSELVLIQAHCSSMSKILPFESFDGVAFLVCLMPNLHSNPNINPKILGDNDLVIWREREKLDNGKRERERERERG